MRIALICDTHYGVRNDNALILNENKTFFNNVFFPYIDKHRINTVIHLGDVVDRRKYINFNTASRLRRDLFDPLLVRGIQSHFIIGNHDTYYKDTNDLNVMRELCKEGSYDNFFIYDQYPEEIVFDDLHVLFIPWINTDKEFALKAYNKIAESTAPIAMGHLEIQGFEMFKGSVVSHGQDRNIFNKFDSVYSGHFHHKSTDGHIFYLGTHAEFTWSDFDDPKGFHIFDTETRSIEFIRNPAKLFHKIIYNDADKNFLEQEIDYSIYKNAYVKIIIKEKSNLYWYDKFIENIEKFNPYDLQTVEDSLNLSLEEDSDIVDEAESTIDICFSYTDKIDMKDIVKTKVKSAISELYNEAISLR